MKDEKAQHDWCRRRLGDVATVLSGATPKTSVPDYWNGDLVWLTPKDLGTLETIEVSASERRITQQGFDSCSAQRIPPNSVVMSSRAPIGHLAINTVPVCTNQGCKSFVPKSGLETHFLYWILRGLMPDIQHLGDGATFDEVSKRDLEGFEIPVPPLAEQRRLTMRIEALTSRLEQARQTRQAALAEADNLLSIAQRSEYERLLVDEDTTPLGAIGEVISGGTPAKSVEAYWGGDVPWIAPKEMKRFRIGESSMNVTQRAVDEGAAKLVRKPAVLMVVRGMILAKRVPIAVSTRPLTINQDMKAFIPSKDIEVSFLGHMLCGAAEELQTRVEVAGHGTCKLETPAWSPLPIPVPKAASQRRLVARLDALAARQTELRLLQTETEAKLAAFTPALLAKAFRGDF